MFGKPDETSVMSVNDRSYQPVWREHALSRVTYRLDMYVKPSQVGTVKERFESSPRHSGKALAQLGRTRTDAVRRARAGARWSVGWELGSRWGDIRRTPIPTTERELEQGEMHDARSGVV